VNGRLWFGPVVVVMRIDVGEVGGGAVVEAPVVVVTRCSWTVVEELCGWVVLDAIVVIAPTVVVVTGAVVVVVGYWVEVVVQ
jgi:hypothetical protein